jgi:hypothetical protein
VKPTASRVTPALPGFRAAQENTVGCQPEVATVSQCGGSVPGGFGRPTCRRKVPGSHPEYANGRIRHGLSGAPRRPTQGPRRLRNKIRSRAVPKTESPAWEMRRNLRDKRQDPLLRANGPAPRRDADPETAGPGTHAFSNVPGPGSMATRRKRGPGELRSLTQQGRERETGNGPAPLRSRNELPSSRQISAQRRGTGSRKATCAGASERQMPVTGERERGDLPPPQFFRSRKATGKKIECA